MCTSAGLDVYLSWASIIFGLSGGFFYIVVRNLVLKAGASDPGNIIVFDVKSRYCCSLAWSLFWVVRNSFRFMCKVSSLTPDCYTRHKQKLVESFRKRGPSYKLWLTIAVIRYHRFRCSIHMATFHIRLTYPVIHLLQMSSMPWPKRALMFAVETISTFLVPGILSVLARGVASGAFEYEPKIFLWYWAGATSIFAWSSGIVLIVFAPLALCLTHILFVQDQV